MTKSVRQVLTQYVKKDKDVSYRVQLLVHCFIKFTNGIKEITRMFSSQLNPIRYFKMLILLHRCYYENVFQPQPMLNLLENIKQPTKATNELHKILCNKVIPSYTLYLQKCYHLLNQHQSHAPSPLEQVYIKINLIKRALDFIQILYTFGRYYSKQHTFIVEYNTIVGLDVRRVYNQLRNILIAHVELVDDQLNLQIEYLHERMYVVYYNCYFYQKCIRYQPQNWINTTSNPNILCTPDSKNGEAQTKTNKNLSLDLFSTAHSTNYLSAAKYQWNSETHHKSVLSNEEIESILRLCRDDNHKQVSDFKLSNQQTVIAEFPFEDQTQQQQLAYQQKNDNELNIKETQLEGLPPIKRKLLSEIS